MAPARRRAGDWSILLTLSLGFFMTLLDLTIVNVAIPEMRRTCTPPWPQIGWVINAYIIVLAVLMITPAGSATCAARRNLFIIGVAVFTLASAACGLSRRPRRADRGPRRCRAWARRCCCRRRWRSSSPPSPPHRRGTALGIWGGVAGAGRGRRARPSAACWSPGWTGGGSSSSTCRSARVIIVVAAIVLPDGQERRRQPLDLPGVLIGQRGLVAMTYGLVEGQSIAGGRHRGVLIGARGGAARCISCLSRRAARTGSRCCRSRCSATATTR